MDYATVSDLELLWRPLDPQEIKKAPEIIEMVCSNLRMEAKKVGKNLDTMIAKNPDLLNVAKSVVVDVTARYLNSKTDQEAMTQISQSAMGYTMSGTYLTPGGGLFIKKSELAKLGLKKQRMSGIQL